jgi:hypothetical protein
MRNLQMRDLTIQELETVSGGCTNCTGKCTYVQSIGRNADGLEVQKLGPACGK